MKKLRPDIFCLGLLDSIHTIDIRMDEIRLMMAKAPNKQERRTEIRNRLAALQDTRGKLIESLTLTIKTNPTSVFAKQFSKNKSTVLERESAYGRILKELKL